MHDGCKQFALCLFRCHSEGSGHGTITILERAKRQSRFAVAMLKDPNQLVGCVFFVAPGLKLIGDCVDFIHIIGSGQKLLVTFQLNQQVEDKRDAMARPNLFHFMLAVRIERGISEL